MNERGTELMRKASRQLDEIPGFFGTLNDADLRKPCPGNSGGGTVGAVAAHIAQGYHFLGEFLQAGRYVPWSAVTGNRKGRGHRYRHGHLRAFAPAALPDLMDRLTVGMLRSACWRTRPTSSLTACPRQAAAGSPTESGLSSR